MTTVKRVMTAASGALFPRKLISGRPLIIYWSYETPPEQYERTSLSDRLGQFGSMAFHFFGRTRWSRTFKLVH